MMHSPSVQQWQLTFKTIFAGQHLKNGAQNSQINKTVATYFIWIPNWDLKCAQQRQFFEHRQIVLCDTLSLWSFTLNSDNILFTRSRRLRSIHTRLRTLWGYMLIPVKFTLLYMRSRHWERTVVKQLLKNFESNTKWPFMFMNVYVFFTDLYRTLYRTGLRGPCVLICEKCPTQRWRQHGKIRSC